MSTSPTADDPTRPQPLHRTVDVVVLGMGSGGEHVAHKLLDAGLEVAGVEAGLVGGECPFWGCTPSKLLIRSADALAEARRAGHLAGDVDVRRPDLGPAAARVREANHDWDDEAHAGPLLGKGLDLVRGHGRLEGRDADGAVRVRVTTTGGGSDSDTDTVLLTARRGVVLNTGTEPAVPPVEGLAGTPYWTNRDAVALTAAPDSVVVLGGGPIGAELTQVLARFGSRTTLVETEPRLLGPEEPEAGDLLADVLRTEGVDVRTGTTLTRVAHGDGGFTCTLVADHGGDEDGDEDGGEATVTADHLLVATGRRPLLDDLGLETVGLDPAAATVPVDPRCRSAAEGVWAVGDITGEGAFTSVALYQGALVVQDLLGTATGGPDTHPEEWGDYRAVARATFTDPEVGAVGLTEAQAREAGIDVVTAIADVGRDSRGWIHGAHGLIKVVADREAGVLVGATAVSPAGGEVIGLFTTAVHARVPVATLSRMHLAYPTFHRTARVVLAKLGEAGV
ncbi:dihydrolipoyl dehydrogenase family protein [Nocardioides bruguierae]|uniref:NAD(P)/FAD-dependent oxidoreductase n=1 Tax=Nocardioides bruguierae TaxID=2945102 RepID=A0A9X2DA48_9ACTN|nr:NAD(P)/FAD-dependent oxidoreductase [Nocardioides bruguierae]MCM0622122.1 NAD(P)/FAD-dependent oxidoreductase [Nocardioides bruguierae]